MRLEFIHASSAIPNTANDIPETNSDSHDLRWKLVDGCRHLVLHPLKTLRVPDVAWVTATGHSTHATLAWDPYASLSPYVFCDESTAMLDFQLDRHVTEHRLYTTENVVLATLAIALPS